MATSTVPAALKNLGTLLRARPGLIGVNIHTADVGAWTDAEAIVFGRVQAPQLWSTMSDPGIDENVTLDGYVFTELAGMADAQIDASRDRAGVILGELAQQLRDDRTFSSAVVAAVDWPLLTSVTWTTWPAEVGGVAIFRTRVDWEITWTVGVT